MLFVFAASGHTARKWLLLSKLHGLMGFEVIKKFSSILHIIVLPL